MRSTPSAAIFESYAILVHEYAVTWQLMPAANEIIALTYNKEGISSGDLIEKAKQRVFKIAE